MALTRKQRDALRFIVTLLRKHRIPFQVSGGLALRIDGILLIIAGIVLLSLAI